jgi:transposase-like protein
MQRLNPTQFLFVFIGYFRSSRHSFLTAVFTFIFLLSASEIHAQNDIANERAAYLKVITERAGKIAAGLGISDSAKEEKVRNMIRDQYDHLNTIYTNRDKGMKLIKARYKDDQALRDTAVAAEKKKTEKALAKLHPRYLRNLNRELTPEQVEKVKNGMTYNVLPITYQAYQEEILTLTRAQKEQILIWLTEAREHAIDAESSDKKHAWFGKYKGRINNYLSAAGYDLKKEGEEWQKRIKAQAN